MVDAGFRLDATVLLGGGAISPRLLDDVAAGGHVRRVVRSYGLTETAGGCVYDGVAFPGVEVAAPTGRLQIRGPVLAAGQLGPTGLVPITDDEGWLVTNDLGAVDDGIVSVVGRVDDVVVTGGVNVAPAAVEVVLEDDPAVSRAGVVGLHDEQWGQRVVAAVVPHGGRTPQVDALRERVRDQLGAAAVPKEVRIVADLPLSALGKVQRDRLHDRLAPPAG
jgi:O-succinylbenzoic acid--CoA ligase